MIRAEHIEAIETRLRWLKWLISDEGYREAAAGGFQQALPIYRDVLETADTYYMDPHFADLVEHARLTIPDTMSFDFKWLQSDHGWLYINPAFRVPNIDDTRMMNLPDDWQPLIRAIAWRRVPPGQRVFLFPHSKPTTEIVHEPRIQFMTFMIPPSRFGYQEPAFGFTPWSYFMLSDGDQLCGRIEAFESVSQTAQPVGSAYIGSDARLNHPQHEIRWLYAAMYLMAQRLAVTVKHQTDRPTRRRAAREGQHAPDIYRVITLRRLMEDQEREHGERDVDWRWQWIVRGHWRKQPTNDGIKDIFIDAFVKGPADKPMKPETHKLFSAER